MVLETSCLGDLHTDAQDRADRGSARVDAHTRWQLEQRLRVLTERSNKPRLAGTFRQPGQRAVVLPDSGR